MFIEFRQVLEHREMQEAVPCAICGCRFDTESVVAQAIGNDFFAPERPGDPVGVACPACVEYLGKRNLERFPTVEEHEAALRRYPSPVFASDEDLNRTDREGTISAAYDASWIAGVQLTEFGAVLFELMRGRCVGDLSELVALAKEASHEITVEEFDGLVYGEGEMLPRSGSLSPISEVLGTNEEEERRLFEKFKACALSGS